MNKMNFNVLIILSLLFSSCRGEDLGYAFSKAALGQGLAFGNYFLGSCVQSGVGQVACTEYYGPSLKSSAVQSVCNDQNNLGGMGALYTQSVCDQKQSTYECQAMHGGIRVKKFYSASYSIGQATADCNQIGGQIQIVQ